MNYDVITDRETLQPAGGKAERADVSGMWMNCLVAPEVAAGPVLDQGEQVVLEQLFVGCLGVVQAIGFVKGLVKGAGGGKTPLRMIISPVACIGKTGTIGVAHFVTP